VEGRRKVVLEWKYTGILWWSESKEEGLWGTGSTHEGYGGVKVKRKAVWSGGRKEEVMVEWGGRLWWGGSIQEGCGGVKV
jgi:hypothetical protein